MTSMAPLDRTVRLAGSEATARLIDYPGHPRLGSGVPDFLRAAKRVVFAVDAAGDEGHLGRAAEALFDLLTLPQLGERGLPLLLLGCKADAPGARPPAALREALEAALTRVKDSRASILATGEADAVGVLGRKGKAFTFAAHAPVPVAFGAVSAQAGTGLQEVLHFITE